ncbi:MAG: alpha/beta hydrolase [Xanthobacteraceae bacterium]|nr:alpha/beta hydrolase [Xanthobacteraceae bacterium]
MNLTINGADAFVATGGKPLDASLPAILFLHGAGFDHSVWALQSRWFAHHGYGVLAPDLPGHGRSAGAPLATIAALADWSAALLGAAGVARARVVGHSMGSLVALELAARHPDNVTSLALIGTAAAVPVGPDLLKAAEANDHDAVDMVTIWGLGFAAELGGNRAPGLWMHGGAERVLEANRPGVLYTDLAACNAYQDGAAAAARIAVPTTLIIGEPDLMTPPRGGRALAALIKGSRTVTLAGAGHTMMVERPDEVLDELIKG